jgi:predicted nucleotidyltransferase
MRPVNNSRETILKTLAYFDLFHYPLTREELISFSCQQDLRLSVDMELESLLRERIIFKIDFYYSLQNTIRLAERRRKGNLRADSQLSIARRAAGILSRFPFVRSVAISGSLSKRFAEEQSDIDFFIITDAGRLWIARTCMHLFKKLTYIVGKQNCFCMNYYVDEEGLEIPEKNVFTAMEIVTLLPMQGTECFTDFLQANSWADIYFPVQPFGAAGAGRIHKGALVRFFERVLRSGTGDRLDHWLMRLTAKRWKKKTLAGKVNDHGDKMDMMVGRHFSKPNPASFQAGILRSYESRLRQLLAAQSASV